MKVALIASLGCVLLGIAVLGVYAGAPWVVAGVFRFIFGFLLGLSIYGSLRTLSRT